MLLDLIKENVHGQMYFDFEMLEIEVTDEFKVDLNFFLNARKSDYKLSYKITGFIKDDFYLEITLLNVLSGSLIYYRYDLVLNLYSKMVFRKNHLYFIEKGFENNDDE